jgi:hypothetical protein
MTAPRYYLDTEFIDDGNASKLELISIGIVCDDGRELYLVSNEFKLEDCGDWLRENVLNQLPPRPHHPDRSGPWRTRAEIADAIRDFVIDPGNDVKPEFWAFFASYDWVLMTQLFGRMINLPPHFPWLVNDLKVWAKHMGYTGKFKELLPNSGHHDALADARWNRDVHKILLEKFAQRDALLAYVQHGYDCDWLQPMWHKGPCDCGLTALIQALPGAVLKPLIETNEHVRATVEELQAQREREAQEKRP